MIVVPLIKESSFLYIRPTFAHFRLSRKMSKFNNLFTHVMTLWKKKPFFQKKNAEILPDKVVFTPESNMIHFMVSVNTNLLLVLLLLFI